MADNGIIAKWKGLSRWRRWSLITLFLLLCYTVFGFFILPAILQSQLEKRLTDLLHRQTTVREVKVNPYSLEVAVNGFTVRDRPGRESFISFDSFVVNLQAFSLVKRALIVRSCSLVNPAVRVVRNEDQSYNFSDLLTGTGPAEEQEGEGRPFLFSINNIHLSGGSLLFADRPRQTTHTVENLHFSVPFLSNLPYEVDIYTSPSFGATVNGAPLQLDGESKPFVVSRDTDIEFRFMDINLVDYLAYLPEELNITVPAGWLDTELVLSFLHSEEGGAALELRGNIRLRDIKIEDGDGGDILSFPLLQVEVAAADVFRRDFHLSRIFLETPQLNLIRLADGSLNLNHLLAPGAEEADPGGPEKAAGNEAVPTILVDETVIERAAVRFHDIMAGDFETRLDPVSLKATSLGTAEDNRAAFLVELATESGEELKLEGDLSLFPLRVEGKLRAGGIAVAKYRPYYGDVFTADLGIDEVEAGASFVFREQDANLLLSDISLDLAGIEVSGDDPEGALRIAGFHLGGSSLDLKGRTITLATVETSGGSIPVVRRGDGSLHFRDFLAAPGPAADDAETGGETEENGEEPPPWQLTLQSIGLDNYDITFIDRLPAKPARLRLAGIRLNGRGLSTRQGEKGEFDLDLAVEDRGRVKLDGTVVLSPLALAVDAELSDIPVQFVQPYLGGRLNVLVREGSIGANGRLDLQEKEEGFVFSVAGDANASDFAFLDTRLAEELVVWDEIGVRGLDYGNNPSGLAIEEVLLDGLHASLKIDSQGVLNLATVFPEKEEENGEEAQEEGEQDGPDIVVKRVVMKGGAMELLDQSVNPSFETALREVNGTVEGLSSRRDVLADVDMKAKLGRHSPLTITGTIHPWQDFHTNFRVSMSDLELSPMSPYSIKYIGYPLEKGKLTLELHYVIDGRELDSENKAFIDQINLGEFVENDTASVLPVKLAIALLKDRSGEIDLNIPVSGDLGDPEFSVGGVIVKVLFNLIAKAATSPFALLGAVLGGEDEVQYVAFEVGRAAIPEKERDELAELARALYERPAIKVELKGFMVPDLEREKILEQQFSRLLKVEKYKELVEDGTEVAGPEAVEIGPGEYGKYLTRAYEEAEFERPRNFFGFLKEQPVAVMEKMLRDHLEVTGNELRLLAVDRTTAVKDFLVKNGPVEPARIFLVEPVMNGGQGGDLPPARVEMTLK